MSQFDEPSSDPPLEVEEGHSDDEQNEGDEFINQEEYENTPPHSSHKRPAPHWHTKRPAPRWHHRRPVPTGGWHSPPKASKRPARDWHKIFPEYLFHRVLENDSNEVNPYHTDPHHTRYTTEMLIHFRAQRHDPLGLSRLINMKPLRTLTLLNENH